MSEEFRQSSSGDSSATCGIDWGYSVGLSWWMGSLIALIDSLTFPGSFAGMAGSHSQLGLLTREPAHGLLRMAIPDLARFFMVSIFT